jgi:Matrixin
VSHRAWKFVECRVAFPGLVFACLVGSTSTSWAFRSSADLPEFEGQALVVMTNPTLVFELNESVPPGLNQDVVQREIQRAVDTWTEPGCTNLVPGEVVISKREAKPGDGRNSVQWVSDWNGRGFPKASPGATDVQYVKDQDGQWVISEADVYLNLNFDWTTDPALDDRKSVRAVLTHEFGHALGLLHPCELDGADGAPECSSSAAFATTEMYPVYSPTQVSLTDDDVAGLCFLYAPGCRDSTCPTGTLCVGGACVPRCGDASCAPSFECVNNQCVSTGCDGVSCLGNTCADDSDCAPREFCEASRCARGMLLLGDACQHAHDCADGACLAGTCAQACSTRSPCRDGRPCDVDTGACHSELAPMGASCHFATDCSGGYCAADGASEAFCTRPCGDGEPPCPSGWVCRRANGERVCSADNRTSGACSFAPASSSPFPFLELMTSLSFASWCFMRRRRHSQVTL